MSIVCCLVTRVGNFVWRWTTWTTDKWMLTLVCRNKTILRKPETIRVKIINPLKTWPDLHKPVLYNHVLWLTACHQSIKLKLRVVWHFTHSIKTSLRVWAVTSESIMAKTKNTWEQLLLRFTKQERGIQNDHSISKGGMRSIKKFEESHTVQSKSGRGKKWKVSKTLERNSWEIRLKALEHSRQTPVFKCILYVLGWSFPVVTHLIAMRVYCLGFFSPSNLPS